MYDLTWTRQAPGSYTTDTTGDTEFRATVARQGAQWYVALTTCGLPLEAWFFPTLAEGKSWAEATFRVVEGGPR